MTLWQAFGGIREAIAVLQTGSPNDVLGLCARSAGWDVQRREGGKGRPLDKLRAELRQSILSATRRHLEARGTVMEIVASPGETHRVARSDDSHPAAASCADAEPSSTSSAAQRTSAKRPLRIAPETHRVVRSDDSHLAADIDSLHKRVRGAIINVAADEPDALDLASPGQASESSGAHASTAKRKGGAGAHRALPNTAASRSRTKGRKITDKELTELAGRLADRRQVLEMRLKSTNLDPEKAAEYRFLQQVVGELHAKAPRSVLDAFAKKCGFTARHHGDRIADTRERLLKAWEEAVDSGLPVLGICCPFARCTQEERGCLRMRQRHC